LCKTRARNHQGTTETMPPKPKAKSRQKGTTATPATPVEKEVSPEATAPRVDPPDTFKEMTFQQLTTAGDDSQNDCVFAYFTTETFNLPDDVQMTMARSIAIALGRALGITGLTEGVALMTVRDGYENFLDAFSEMAHAIRP